MPDACPMKISAGVEVSPANGDHCAEVASQPGKYTSGTTAPDSRLVSACLAHSTPTKFSVQKQARVLT